MLISHEIPKTLFSIDELISDYPYVLGHLISLDKDYKNHYIERLKKSNFSILDNSAFELGKSIDPNELLRVAKELKPTHLILPDTLHDMQTTIEDSINFYRENVDFFQENNITPIGVVQGNSFEELALCYQSYLEHGIGYIAIPFDCIKDSDWSIVRYLFFNYLCNSGLIEFAKDIHFLGIKNPQELLLYSPKQKSYISSIDTSSPIIHGWKGNEYTEFGCLFEKPSLKLADNLDVELDANQLSLISHNIKKFREYVSR